MRICQFCFALLFFAGLATACFELPDPCTAENNCYRDAHGLPGCFDGYVWEDPNSITNLNCVPASSSPSTESSGSQTGETTNTGETDNGRDPEGNTGTPEDPGGQPDDSGNSDPSDDSGPCPPNSSLNPAGDACYCDDGYEPNAELTACVESDSDTSTNGNPCPPNSHLEGDACYCNEGYWVNEDQTACVAECEVDTDCASGLVCIEHTCRPPPCTPNSCEDGLMCDLETGNCIADVGMLPSPPPLNCDVLPADNCADNDLSCIPSWQCRSNCSELVPFEPVDGDGYWNYPLNGETWNNQYRSYIRRDVMMLVKYAAASVRCMSQNWNFANRQPLGLGDMSEADGSIPGTSVGSPGHPSGTHVDGHDMDIAYYQMTSADNRLRAICEHTQNGIDQYHCVSTPNNLDVWRTALFLAKVQDTPAFRVAGVDGQVGQLVDSAVSQMCQAGWVNGNACSRAGITYEVTNTGRGWFQFHHHHFHISISGTKSRGLDNCLTSSCDEPARAEDDPRRRIYRHLPLR